MGHFAVTANKPLQEAGASLIARPRLVAKIAPPGCKLTYIHAGAGYGKTTLLMQFARNRPNVVWLSLDERDSDLPHFLRHLEEALKAKLRRLDFHAADHIPFVGRKGFLPNVLAALLGAVGGRRITLILDDVHVLDGSPAARLLSRLAADCPPSLTLVMAGRHQPWAGLFRLKVEGRLAEIGEPDLRFSRAEAEELWGFFDEAAYSAAEGWAFALQAYRMVAAGRGRPSLPEADRDLERYLMQEILGSLPEVLRHFLLATAWLPELSPDQCDELLGTRGSKAVLDELVRRNLFTTRVSPTAYRYHALFSAFLRQAPGDLGRETLRQAMALCFARGDYERAADYALLADDAAFVHDCVSAALGRPFGVGRYRSLGRYFGCLEAHRVRLSPRVLLARGMYLSSQGRFLEADGCLEAALRNLGDADRDLYLQAMTHRARILRNRASVAESDRCLDALLPLPEDAPMPVWYMVMIERIHNLVLSSRLAEALALTRSMVEKCLSRGDTKVAGWFERYLTVIQFYRGEYADALRCYEKSLSIPQEEQDWLLRHPVGAYAAKAYQLTGEEEKSLPLMEEELSRLRELVLHEELGLNHLVYADILLTAELASVGRGKTADLSGFYRHLDLADKHAALNPGRGDRALLAGILRLVAGLVAGGGKASALTGIGDALEPAERSAPFFGALAYGYVALALHLAGGDPDRCKTYYRRCVEIGEASGTCGFLAVAYGGLAALALREGDRERAEGYTRRFLELSQDSGQRYYFRFRTLFDGVLKLALEHGPGSDFARVMYAYGGYEPERVYIHTLGRLYISSTQDKGTPVRVRTRKSRELLAYLLEHREGVSRQRICADLWGDSEANVTSLFHTRRGEIRRAYESLGARNPILYEKGLYRLSMEETVCDYDAFREAAREFRRQPTRANAEKVVGLYTGRYLDDLEALWAESTRLSLEEDFLAAVDVLLESYKDSGERGKSMELVRRCAGLSYQEHGYGPGKEKNKKAR